MVVSFTKIGTVLVQQNDRSEALTYFEEGKTIMERLMKLDPSNAQWKNDLAWIKNRIAKLKE